MVEPTEEHPLYEVVPASTSSATQRYLVTCDEGWRRSIVCEGMYRWAAEWLVQQLQGKPYAPGHRP